MIWLIICGHHKVRQGGALVINSQDLICQIIGNLYKLRVSANQHIGAYLTCSIVRMRVEKLQLWYTSRLAPRTRPLLDGSFLLSSPRDHICRLHFFADTHGSAHSMLCICT